MSVQVYGVNHVAIEVDVAVLGIKTRRFRQRLQEGLH